MNIGKKIELVPVGELPPVGVVPEKMHAWTLRSDRLGDPMTAFRDEVVDIPELKKGEVLIANVAAGINFNGLWAAKGKPVDVIRNNAAYGDKKEDFHICGSESSGIVYAVGEGVTSVKKGNRVSVIGYRYNPDCPFIKNGGEPEYSPSFHIWGYEGNWGAFAQFSKVADYQCLPLGSEISWTDAAAFSATGLAVHRMFTHWKENRIRKNDVVLIWGGAGGLGTMAIQEAKYYGAVPVAVVSDDDKGKFCMELGAKGYIKRTDFNHWGTVSELSGNDYKRWIVSATRFRNQLYKIVGEKRLADIVLEHPGSSTLATSLFVCAPGGMVALCGATTGFMGTIDLRYLWMYQKRIQGSHAATHSEAIEFVDIMSRSGIRPVTEIISWNELPSAHAELDANKKTYGKSVMRICSDETAEKVLLNEVHQGTH